MKALAYALCLVLAAFAQAEPALHHTLAGKAGSACAKAARARQRA